LLVIVAKLSKELRRCVVPTNWLCTRIWRSLVVSDSAIIHLELELYWNNCETTVTTCI